MSAPVVISIALAKAGEAWGWGAVIQEGAKRRQASGGEVGITGQRAELAGVMRAFLALPSPSVVTVHCHLGDIPKTMADWFQGWKANGWKNSTGKPPKNTDLWQALDALIAKHQVEWVKGGGLAPEALAAKGAKEALARHSDAASFGFVPE